MNDPVNRPASGFFVTGTDTGVGKTVLAGLLTCHLRDAGVAVAALKPVCSGTRDDARLLRAASGNALSLDEVNPWHFRAPLAPLVAARRQKRTLRLEEVRAHVRRMRARFEAVVVEGAGGLLSPLGDSFDSRDLIIASGAMPIVVCPNRLGAINQCLLAQAALPSAIARHAQVVLMSPARPGPASRSNRAFLAAELGARRTHVVPWLKCPEHPARALADRRTHTAIRVLVKSIGL